MLSRNHFVLTLLCSAVVFFPKAAWSDTCSLSYVTESHLKNASRNQVPELAELQKAMNQILKKTYHFANRIDQKTFGLISSLTSGTGASLENLKPSQWDRLFIAGSVVYQGSDFLTTQVRGAQIELTEGTISRTVRTGAQGEFSENLTRLVPYARLRLFPGPIFEIGKHEIPIMKIPIRVKIESTICNGETTIDEVPIEPIVLILTPQQKIEAQQPSSSQL